MAQPTTNGCLKSLLLTILGLVLLVVLVAGIGSAVILNMTPEKLGIADADIADGKTLRDMGLAEVKIKEIVKLFISLMDMPEEGDIVNNSYNEADEKPKAESNMDNSSLDKKSDGSYDYTSILTDKVTYDKEYLKEYNDTTIAYMFDSIIKSAENNSSDNSGVQFLKDISATINEVSLTKSGDKFELRIVVSAMLDNYTKEFNESTPSFMSLPDKVYIVSYSEVTADSNGKLVATSKDLRINDAQSVVADAIFSILASELESKTDVDASDKNKINAEILSAFSDVILNLGKIGTANVVTGTDEVVSDSAIFGEEGLKNHAITVITYAADEALGEEAA